ncbi:MAG TPA: tRNA (adenosine(37)-N6)-threonylcarbamoyltransferase complex ATPase subunit type 1 TsaE [Candidatus Babeliales bacterium]|nr:tRNA (adenosine(37)-N6)-threonylcarbamoyltransferase complex ATPase subunit type 1 TsaE [Candidatus Babeliales bacterium]
MKKDLFEQVCIVYGIDEVERIALTLLSLRDRVHIFTFTGSLGAGKTTLVRAMLKQVGVRDVITSPTFTYVNLYTGYDGETIYHFDCYRLKTTDEFLQAGFDEYIYQQGSVSIIEWPDVVMPLLHQELVCHVTIDYVDDIQRKLCYRISR